MERHIYSCGD